MADQYDLCYGDQPSDDARLGQAIYREALSDRRGFRADQVGIEINDPVWTEIFEDIGSAARRLIERSKERE